jgi:cytochrome c-type biogenesis protein
VNQLFDFITRALSVPSALAYGAALLWGLASVVLSPCHLASIPLVIGYVNSGRKPSMGRALLLSSLFAVGILATLGILGVIAGLLGTLAGNVGVVPQLVVSLLLVVSGLWLMDVPPFSRFSIGFPRGAQRRGVIGALVLGLVYGVVLGPCSFAFLAPMVGIAFSAGSASWMFGASLMAVYALGHCGAIQAAGTLGDRLCFLLENKGWQGAAAWVKRACGLAVAGAGILQALRALGMGV